MDALFSGAPADLGPTRFLPADWPIRRTQIVGRRSTALRTQVRLLGPGQPGVYAMLNDQEEVIYVGKAKDLRKRLLSYFRPRSRDRRAAKIISRARGIVWEVLPSEFTALLRELELIRRWRPTWNVRGQPLRRRHAYLCLGRSPAPYLFLSRTMPRETIAAFGPLPVTTKTRQAARWLNDLFLLRDCPPGPVDLYPEPSPLIPLAPPAGCLRLELGTCSGPCMATARPASYRRQVEAARQFLTGNDPSILADLEARMRAAARDQRFERAAALRDKWTVLTWLLEKLETIRKAQRELSLIYPLATPEGRTLWYLLHGARVMSCVHAPKDSATAKAAAAELDRIYGKENASAVLDAYEPIDGMVLILGWFRAFPSLKRRCLSPAEAKSLATRSS